MRWNAAPGGSGDGQGPVEGTKCTLLLLLLSLLPSAPSGVSAAACPRVSTEVRDARSVPGPFLPLLCARIHASAALLRCWRRGEVDEELPSRVRRWPVLPVAMRHTSTSGISVSAAAWRRGEGREGTRQGLVVFARGSGFARM